MTTPWDEQLSGFLFCGAGSRKWLSVIWSSIAFCTKFIHVAQILGYGSAPEQNEGRYHVVVRVLYKERTLQHRLEMCWLTGALSMVEGSGNSSSCDIQPV